MEARATASRGRGAVRGAYPGDDQRPLRKALETVFLGPEAEEDCNRIEQGDLPNVEVDTDEGGTVATIKKVLDVYAERRGGGGGPHGHGTPGPRARLAFLRSRSGPPRSGDGRAKGEGWQQHAAALTANVAPQTYMQPWRFAQATDPARV